MRLDFNEEETTIIARADNMQAEAKALRQTGYDQRDARDERPVKDRMTFAATWRCPCGHGMAYDPLVRASKWECSGILLGIADKALLHTRPAPFAYYEAKSENQPSADGQTTREPADPSPDAFPAKTEA